MAEFSVDRVASVNRALPRYRFRSEYQSLLIIDGVIDRAEQRQFIQIGLAPHFPSVEAYWIDNQGYGRYPGSEEWLSFQDGPFSDYLALAADMLQEVPSTSVREEGAFWLVEIVPTRLPLRDDPEGFYRGMLGEPADDRGTVFMERLIEMSRNVDVRAYLQVSREDGLIYALTVRGGTGDVPVEMVIEFMPADEPAPAPPPDVAWLVTAEASLMAFLLPIPRSGWCVNRSHSAWAQRSLDLIKSEDASSAAYTEIYHSSWQTASYDETTAGTGPPDYLKHHPIVLGAHNEDESSMPAYYGKWLASDPNYQSDTSYYYSQSDYARDNHHYGYQGTGLEYHWYYKLREIESGVPCPARPMPGDRYYSARDWGFGGTRIDPKLNRLTFTEAIKQYNRYSLDGKRVAYLMLGHVVHLFQDNGHPDHARLVAHPGSSKTEPEIFKYYCPILAGEIALIACAACWSFCWICGPAAFGIAIAACHSTVSSNEVGYEELIGSHWSMSRVEQTIQNTGVLTPAKAEYDQFFATLGKLSTSTSLQSVLGCGSLTLPPLPTIPGIDPDIDLNDTAEVNKYYAFTDQIVPQIIGGSAGLIQHFYEIVNYPPILERVAIVQWQAGDTPRAFAFFADDKDHCVRYDAKWVHTQNARILQQTKKQSLSLDRPAYVFLQFGPATIGPEKGKAMAEVDLLVKWKGQEERVTLTEAYDSDSGYYYWGSFTPYNCAPDPFMVSLVVTGKDRSAHLASRSPSGYELDSDPSTVATVDASQYPGFPLKGYTPGADTHHQIWMAALQAPVVVATPASVTVSRQETVTVEIQQKAWDCHWEPTFGPVTCPVTWKVRTRLEETEVDDRQNGKLILTIRPRRGVCPPGAYSIWVEYTFGAYQGTLTIPVQVVG